MTHLINDIYGVEVPKGAERFCFGYDNPNWIYYYLKNSANSFDHRHIELPSGSYSIIGKGDELDSDKWESIVDYKKHEDQRFYPDYTSALEFFDNPIQSGHSLLKSKNLKPEPTLIIKKH